MAEKKRRIKDAKAAQIKRKRRARKWKRFWFLLSQMFLFVILAGAWYVVKKYDRFQVYNIEKGQIVINEGVKKEGYTTIALFGGDSREGILEAGTHADTIMIAAIDNQTKEVRVASVYRDTLMLQEDEGLNKANSAYFRGGPQAAINMLNRNLDLDIQDYVTVDFKALADAIDTLGGIEVDVTAEEAAEANRYVGETASVVGKQANLLSQGTQTLDGVQAVTYARIRKNVGGDYKRTERQRLVVEKVAQKLKNCDLTTLNSIIDQSFSQVSTSFTLADVLKLATGAMQYRIAGTVGFPSDVEDGRVDGIGSVVVPKGMKVNVEQLHNFLYPKEEYQSSKTVERVDEMIKQITGIYESETTGE